MTKINKKETWYCFSAGLYFLFFFPFYQKIVLIYALVQFGSSTGGLDKHPAKEML